MIHLPPLAAEIIFFIGSWPVTNSMIMAWIVTILLCGSIALWGRRYTDVPRGLQAVLEISLEALLGLIDEVTNDRKQSERFLPIIGTLFIFILFANWLGVFPGIGSIGYEVEHEGTTEFLPLFRPANADINMTLAMSVVTVVVSHVLGILAIGFWKYADRFVPLGTLWRSVRSGGADIFVGIVEFFIGLVEIVGELAKILSLSLRLFGNIFAGEVLLTVIAGLVAFFVPLPFLLLEILVGFIQATVFSMLALVYLSMATTDHSGAGHAPAAGH